MRHAIGGMTTLAMLALAALCSGVLLQPAAAQPAPGIRHIRMNIVSSRSSLGGTNPADAQAAGNVWLHTIGRRRGFDVDGSFTVAPNLDAIRKQVDDSSVDAELGRIWMETMRNDHRLGPAENLFNSVTRANKPSSACLPVFFGKQDACILDSAGWEPMTELNPQLVSRMQTLATSPAYRDGILCVHVRYRAYRDEFKQILVELHKDPEGKQLPMVFRAEYAVAVTESFTGSARDLWKQYATFAHPSATSGAVRSRGAP